MVPEPKRSSPRGVSVFRLECSFPKKRAGVTCHELKSGSCDLKGEIHRILTHPSQIAFLSSSQQFPGPDVILGADDRQTLVPEPSGLLADLLAADFISTLPSCPSGLRTQPPCNQIAVIWTFQVLTHARGSRCSCRVPRGGLSNERHRNCVAWQPQTAIAIAYDTRQPRLRVFITTYGCHSKVRTFFKGLI